MIWDIAWAVGFILIGMVGGGGLVLSRCKPVIDKGAHAIKMLRELCDMQQSLLQKQHEYISEREVESEE